MKEALNVVFTAHHDLATPELGRPDYDVSAQVSVQFDPGASIDAIVAAIHYAAAQAVTKAIEARPEADASTMSATH